VKLVLDGRQRIDATALVDLVAPWPLKGYPR
jgi:hypothetical protein